jgi:hypothetical protein
MRTVALYGNSLALASIAAALKGRPGLRVLPAQQLGTIQPDVAVFDLAAADPVFATALRKAQPGLLCIGVDLAAGQALVLYGQSSRMLTADDLVETLETHPLVQRSNS